MKYLALSFFLSIFIWNCSDTPSAPPSDIEYNIDDVRILLPREFQKIDSDSDIKELFFKDKSQIDPMNQLLLDKMKALTAGDNHRFVKYDERHLTFITLKTDGPLVSLNKENTDYLLEQFEKISEVNFMTSDSSYYFRHMDSKLTGANAVKYFKFKYFHHDKDMEWYTTNYLIYANSRTIGLSIVSPHRHHQDLEKHMQFINIK